ncbi:uncharacterized protein PGTG_02099 [Puccinia graminis f. sp. tritici CRL 75-36-700-3]|uniref:DUF4219 domain-containing protein n=1 Tax=Puccinia graminis f. sp. tritici (strain CRL 75-36-700-3 / race SCCL) TaxID=418459 RepID=E3JX63_PUCGT|nr:uncharacterized protein PGTG_02099 [Puccinia graminis f. sp. tritici CRL 75-36-700-3]EFP76638.2 hypothetical protein PGTG_02099 [Puccinia graminis f. sp. tritici CRL 75-36-700-3]
MAEKSIHHLPLLTKVNFQNWKNIMFSYCLERNLDDHLLSDLVKEEKDAVAKISLQDKKAAAAGILGRNLGVENYAKFITEDNRKQPHLIWSALIDHFQSDTSQNHAVVYRDFLSIKYTSSLEQFITDVDCDLREPHTHRHIQNRSLVGMCPPSMTGLDRSSMGVLTPINDWSKPVISGSVSGC